MHFTYNPSASFRGCVFLVFASATTAPLRFPRFLVVVGFISFHFGLLGLHLLSFWPFGPSFAFFFWFFFCYVRLSWAWSLRGHRQGVLFGHVFLPRCFREASARLPRNTEAKPVTKPTQHRIGVIWQQFIPKSNSNTGHENWATSGYSNSLFYPLYFTNIPFRNLPRRTPFREASAAFRGLNPVHFLKNKKLRKLLHKNGKKKRNSCLETTTQLHFYYGVPT